MIYTTLDSDEKIITQCKRWENIPSIAKATIILDGGYRVLTKDDVVTILRESMK